MSANGTPTKPVTEEKVVNLKALRLAGGVLFTLGFLAYLVVIFQPASLELLKMVLYAGLLVALGYPTLLYVRALEKIAQLEKRLQELEKK